MQRVTVWEKVKIVLATVVVSGLFWLLHLLGELHLLSPDDFEKKE